MSDLSLIPLQDGFETQLSQDWDGATGTIYVLATPSYTPTTENTYIVVNPGKTNMQIAEITDYDSTAKTLTVSSISFEKGLGISSTAQSHSTGSKVIISDNYQFWEDIQTAINTKLDDTGGTMTGLLQFSGTTHAGVKVNSLTTTQRDALTPANGNIIYNSTAGEFQVYQGGAWSTLASGSTQPNASTTVLGKIKTDVTPAGDPVALITDNPKYDALAGTSGSPSTSNKYVTNDDTGTSGSGKCLRLDGSGKIPAVDGSQITSISGQFGGNGSDGALSITSGTTTIDCANASVVIKNYTSISITGTGVLAFSNPSNTGTVIVLRSQGNVTLTSSATPMIDLRLIGASGGAGVASSNSANSGTTGSVCFTNLFQTNAGVGPNATTTTVGAGGAVPSFLWSDIGILFNKYPILAGGSGGASGSISTTASGSTGTSGAGGRGGGCLLVECGGALNFTTASGISVAGANGAVGTLANAGADTCGAGGGGAGGLSVIYYNSLTANTGTVTVTGGTGGNHVGIAHVNVGGGGGGGSVTTSGSAGLKNQGSGVKDGGNGATGLSIVEANNNLM